MNAPRYGISSVIILLSALVVGLASACKTQEEDRSGQTSSDSQFGSIVAQLEWPATGQITASSGVAPLAHQPASVVQIRATVTGPDMAPVQQTFDAALGSGVIGLVPAGPSRTLVVQGLDVSTNVSYVGHASDLFVEVGKTKSAGIITMTVVDATAPGNVGAFTAVVGEVSGEVRLTWTNPAATDLTGVMIRRSTSAFTTLPVPVTPPPSEGVEVFDNFGATYTVTGLTNGTPYFFAAFAHDGKPNYAPGVALQATPVVPGTDTVRPTVDFHNPTPDGVTNVLVSTPIIVGFSEAMNQTDTAAAFSLAPTVPGAIVWAGGGIILTFTPDADLSAGIQYTVTIGTGAKDLADPGNALAAPFIFKFTTTSAVCTWDVSQWDSCEWAP